MATKAEAIDKLIDVLAGSDVQMHSQDVAGRINQLAESIEDGTITIGGGGGGVSSWNDLTDKPFCVTKTPIYSGSVTTTESDMGFSDNIDVEWPSTMPDIIAVTFEGTEYTAPKVMDNPLGIAYGAFDNEGSQDFTEIPFHVLVASGQTLFLTSAAGDYSASISVLSIDTTNEFNTVMDSVIDQAVSTMPMPVIPNVTTSSEVEEAMSNSRILYYYDDSIGKYHIATTPSIGESTTWTFSPSLSDGSSAFLSNGVFTVYTEPGR